MGNLHSLYAFNMYSLAEVLRLAVFYSMHHPYTTPVRKLVHSTSLSQDGPDNDQNDMFLLGCSFHMVAVNGENTAERPMWTEKGGLDFEGRAKWDAWAAVKGTKPEKAKLEFVKVRTYSYHTCLSSLDACPVLEEGPPWSPKSA